MNKNAIVRSIESPFADKKNIVIVEPIAFTQCSTCTQTCSKRSVTLPAVNKNNFPLKVGSLVIISTSKVQEGIESFISLVFPIMMAILGYICSNPIFLQLRKFFITGIFSNQNCPEGFKALCVILFFAIATFIVLRGFKTKVHFVYPEITNVLETNY